MKKIKKSTRQGRPDLSLEQRQELFRLRKAGLSFQKISDLVGCSKSTISGHINHPSLKKHSKKLPWYEKAKIVHDSVKNNRGRPRDTSWGLKSEAIRSYVTIELKKRTSPWSISQSIRKKLPGSSICAESIYQYIYKVDRELIQYLVRHGKTKRNNRASSNKSRLREIEKLEKRRIEERSKAGNERLEVGHLESDFMVSGGGGKSNLVVAVDRKSRLVRLKLTPNREADVTRRTLFQIFSKFPKEFRKSLTVDNDSAHNHLPQLEKVFKEEELDVLFCNSYSPWERGTVEAIIGIIRRHFPKGTNLDNVSHEEVAWVESWFNDRPMRVLFGKTPNEVYEQELYQLPLAA